MSKENKKLSLIMMLCVIALLLVFFILDQMKRQKELNDFSKYAPIPMEAPAEVNNQEENRSLYNLKTAADSDATLQDSPFRVVIKNMDELAKTPLPDYALWSIETYLDRYFNFYMDSKTNYYGEFVPDSYISNQNLPCFTIHIEALDMDVQCTYYASRQIFRFISDFNPDGE